MKIRPVQVTVLLAQKLEIPEALDGVRRAKIAEFIARRELTKTDKLHIASDLTKEMRRIVLAAQRADLENGRMALP